MLLIHFLYVLVLGVRACVCVCERGLLGDDLFQIFTLGSRIVVSDL